MRGVFKAITYVRFNHKDFLYLLRRYMFSSEPLNRRVGGEFIDPAVCCIVVGSSYPGCAQAAKGAGVHRLKGLVSWVQNVVTPVSSSKSYCFRGDKDSSVTN